MNRLARLMIRLYPRAWRERYGDELEALIEDSGSGWSQVFDLFGEAIRMQLAIGPFGKLAVGLGLAGVIAGLLTSVWIPKSYESDAMMRLVPALVSDQTPAEAIDRWMAARIAMMKNDVLSRKSLSTIIADPRLDLYPAERQTMPLEDVIERMREKDIWIGAVRFLKDDAWAQAFAISFRYPDQRKAQQTVQLLLTRFMDANILDARKAAVNVGDELEILEPPSLPSNPWMAFMPENWQDLIPAGFRPGRTFSMALEFCGGVLLAALAWSFRKSWRVGKMAAAFGIAGVLAGAIFSALVPHTYVSSAALELLTSPEATGLDSEDGSARIRELESQVLSDASLSGTIENLNLYPSERVFPAREDIFERMRQHDLRVTIAPDLPAFTISFEYRDRLKAQQVVQELTGKFIDANVARRRVEPGIAAVVASRGSSQSLDVLDPASLPSQALGPNRYVLAGLGLAGGMSLAGIAAIVWKLRPSAA